MDTVTMLAWRIRGEGHYQGSKTLAIVKGLPFAIIVVKDPGGRYRHASLELHSTAEAEYLLWMETDIDGELILDPTELTVPHPPYVEAQDRRFEEWVMEEVVRSVDAEYLYSKRAR